MQINSTNIDNYKDKEVILVEEGKGIPIKIIGLVDGWLKYFNLNTNSFVEILPNTEIKIYTKKDDTHR